MNSSSGFVDQAGNTVATNYYYPYGGNRSGMAFSGLSTKRFTGQYHESSLPGGEGLSYYNARWYDAQLGRFLSADTMVPGPANPQAFNRYSYTRGNPMRYTDPTGHCVNSTTGNTDESQGYDNSECWRLANTISNMWDDTDYWKNRFTSKDIFLNQVANNAYNDTDFFQSQFSLFLNDDAGKQWLQGGSSYQSSEQPEQDWGDYTAINFSAGFLGGAFIFDDYGNVYYRSDNNFIGSSGLTVSRGDILLHQGGLTWTDIDQLSLTTKDKAALAPDILVGASRGGSLGMTYLAGGIAYNLTGPPHVTAEAGIASSDISLSYSHFSYTFQIYPRIRIR